MNKTDHEKFQQLVYEHGVPNHSIMQRKPDLHLYGNHFKHLKRVYRWFKNGTAIKDGKGWYANGKKT